MTTATTNMTTTEQDTTVCIPADHGAEALQKCRKIVAANIIAKFMLEWKRRADILRKCRRILGGVVVKKFFVATVRELRDFRSLACQMCRLALPSWARTGHCSCSCVASRAERWASRRWGGGW